MKLLPITLATVSLMSCATGPFYQQGSPDLSKSAMFLRENKIAGTILRRTSYFLDGIDGMNCGKAVRFPNGEIGFAVTPGYHKISVAMLHSEPGKGMVTAGSAIPLKVNLGRTYEVMGSIENGQRVDFWIRDRSTHAPASKIISGEAIDHGLPKLMIITPAS
jgi:hypothetical protein